MSKKLLKNIPIAVRTVKNFIKIVEKRKVVFFRFENLLDTMNISLRLHKGTYISFTKVPGVYLCIIFTWEYTYGNGWVWRGDGDIFSSFYMKN